ADALTTRVAKIVRRFRAPLPPSLINGARHAAVLGALEFGLPRGPWRSQGRDDVHLRDDRPRHPRVWHPDPRPRPARPLVHLERGGGRPDVRAPPHRLEPDAVLVLAPPRDPLGPLRPPARPDPQRDRARTGLRRHGPR